MTATLPAATMEKFKDELLKARGSLMEARDCLEIGARLGGPSISDLGWIEHYLTEMSEIVKKIDRRRDAA